MSGINIIIGASIGGFRSAMKEAYEKLGDLEGRAFATGRKMQELGDKMQSLGRKMTVVSAAISATAGAGFLLAKSTAENIRTIERMAQVSNSSTTEFQRMAAGASTVGIEQEKLGDILKDVNDRIGDFNATGGGPMADFFENIGPKIGVTADHFKDLSGPQALQLYVSSLEKANLNQQDMTFYMETMASDATALLPLLLANGAGMKVMGDQAEAAGAIIKDDGIGASREFNKSLAQLQTAFQAVKDQFAVTLMPVMTDLMDGIRTKVMPAIADLVADIGGWIEAFNGLDPAVQSAVGVIVTAFAVGGPVAIAIGVAVKALGGLLAFMGPQGLIALAVVAGIAAWVTWGEDIKRLAGGALDYIKQKASDFLAVLESIIEAAGRIKTSLFQAFGGNTGMDFNMPGAPVPDGGGHGSDTTGIGVEMGNGLINGLGASLADRQGEIEAYINSIPQTARDLLEIKSPSQVFAAIGGHIGEGLAQGIAASQGLVSEAMAVLGGSTVDSTKSMTQSVLSDLGTLFQGSKKISAGIALANSWLAFTEVLKDPSFVGRPFARIAAAGAALSSGLNAVKAINSAQPGGGGGSGGGSSSAAGGGTTETRTANINFYGGFQPTQESIDMIASGLNDWLGDGGRLNVGGAS